MVNVKNRIIKSSTLTIGIVCSLFLGGCSQNDAQTMEEGSSAEVQSTPVETTFIVRGDIQNTYSTITILEAGSEAKVVARASGILEQLLVEEGDYVKKGAVLAQLDVEQLTLQLAQDEAVLARLKGELEQEDTLFARNLGTSLSRDKAKFDYESQQAKYQLSQLQLRYATITSPIAGLITERMVKQGNLISNNDVLFNIVDPDSLEAVLHLPQKEFSKVKVGQNVLLVMDSFPEMIFAGKIDRIRPMVDTDTGTFRIVSSVNNAKHLLQAGMFGRAELVIDTHKNSLLLTESALITKDNRSHVFVVREKQAVQIPITFDIRQNGLIEITTGLQENDEIIITGQQLVQDGTPVDVIEVTEVAEG